MIPLNQVPQNKRILWYFDPDMCYDLIWIYKLDPILIERAVIVNYPWAEDYSQRLFNDLLPHSYAFQTEDPNNQELLEYYKIKSLYCAETITLPNIPNHYVVFTWLYDNHNIAHDCRYNFNVKHLRRHHRKYSCNGQKIILHTNILKYSLVISCSDSNYEVSEIENQLDDDLFYSKYQPFQWDERIFALYNIYSSRVSPPTGVLVEDFVLNGGQAQLTQGRAEGAVYESTYTISDSVTPIEHGLLIFAKPQYESIESQGITNNIIRGNMPQRVLNLDIVLSRSDQENVTRTITTDVLDEDFESLSLPITGIGQNQKIFNLYFTFTSFSEIFTIQDRVNLWEEVIADDNMASIRTFPDGTRIARVLKEPNFFFSGSGTVSRTSYRYGYWYWPIGFFNDPPNLPAPPYGERPNPIPAFPDRIERAQLQQVFQVDERAAVYAFESEYELNINLSDQTSNVRSLLYREREEFEQNSANLIPEVQYEELEDYSWDLLLQQREDYHNRKVKLKEVVTFQKNTFSPFRYPLNDKSYLNIDDYISKYTTEYLPYTRRPLLSISNQINECFDHLQGIDRISNGGSGGEFILEYTPIPEQARLVLTFKYIMELSDSLRLQEIHACLGADEYAYQDKDADEPEPRVTSVAWLTNRIALALGISYKPDGTIMSVRQRRNIKYNNGNATIPEGWARGQFSVNKGGSTAGQRGGEEDEDRLGIVYQNRCNRYENFNDDDDENNVIEAGDLVLCENIPQFIESYLEDLDKGLNWQEMGTGVLPNADGTGYCTYEGMGTLLAEVAYMISALSSNIMESHSLDLMTFQTVLEILKAIGVPTGVGQIEMDTGVKEAIGSGQPAHLLVPKVAEDAPTLTAQMMNVLSNIALIIGGLSEVEKEEEQPQED